MSHAPHALALEFPDKVNKISALKGADAHFAKLVAEYDAVNEQVHRAEKRIDLISEEDEEHPRKKRTHLKDHIWQHLK